MTKQILVMNKYPIIEMLAFFCRYSELEIPVWRKKYVHHLKRVRSCHSKVDGGVKKSFYTVETKTGKIINLVLNEEELLWELEQSGVYKGFVVDRVLAEVQRHKHLPSNAHRIIPYRFEVFPSQLTRQILTAPALVDRVQPYRFKRRKAGSFQVVNVETRHLENIMITKHLHYVVETDERRFFHFVFVLDQMDWRFMQEVDEQLLFVR